MEIEAYKHNYIVKSSFTSFDINKSDTCRMILDNDVSGGVVLGRCDKATLKFLKKHFHYVAYTGLNGIDANFDQILCDGYAASVCALEYGRCDKATLKFLKKHFHYVAYTGLNGIDANFDQILCDGYAASVCALEYLIELGHRRIGYIGEISSENRYRGYRDIIAKYELPFSNSYVAPVSFSSNGGYTGASRLLTQQPDLTAIFCGNDITAIGAIRAIKDHGLKIPKDISVISIDDIDTAQYLSPTLTTIQIPVEAMGSMAAKVLIDRINGGHTLPMKINFPCHLAIRESCDKPRK